MVWKDCFGKELIIGEDVIIARTGEWNEPIMYSGIILEIGDDLCVITYNSWDNNEETVYNVTFHKFHYEDGVIKCIYKLKK